MDEMVRDVDDRQTDSPVARQFAARSLPFKVRLHSDVDGTIRSPSDFAKALGLPIERISKTLLLRDAGSGDVGYCFAVCSSNARLDMKRVGLLAGWRRAEVADRAALDSVVGLPPTGVAPVGSLTPLPTFIDLGLKDFESILIGGGKVGVELEVYPYDLAIVSGGEFADILPDALEAE
jgi:Cys-tRNA(Pro)/Cys-tRNA(Cys) deacylase